MIISHLIDMKPFHTAVAVIGFWSIVILGMMFVGGDVLDRSEFEARADVVNGERRVHGVRIYRKARNCRTFSALYALRRVKSEKLPDLIIPLNITGTVINQAVGVDTELILEAKVPDTIPPGQYQMRSAVLWRCNPLQIRSHIKYSNVFEIK